MAKSVQCLSGKHKDPRSDPQNTHSTVVCVCNLSVMETEPGDCWDSLGSQSRQSGDLCLMKHPF